MTGRLRRILGRRRQVVLVSAIVSLLFFVVNASGAMSTEKPAVEAELIDQLVVITVSNFKANSTVEIKANFAGSILATKITTSQNGTGKGELQVPAGFRGEVKIIAKGQKSRLAPSTVTVTPKPATSLPQPTQETVPKPKSSVPPPSTSSYNALVLSHKPTMFMAMTGFASGSEVDLVGSHGGAYQGGTPTSAKMPNGDIAAGFNGSSQYLTVTSKPDLSITTTGHLTWEAWIRPDVLQFGSDYINYMGKCAEYAPTCEWEARMYSSATSQGRCHRLSAYAFNPSAGLGSGAYFQTQCGQVPAGKWIHVVGQYNIKETPQGCDASYPGGINIWVNGVKWNQAAHLPTGCMSQYQVRPQANNSPLNIGTMTGEAMFPGAIGKVAIYDYLLSQEQISAHFQAMVGSAPSGSCGDSCTAKFGW